MRRSTRLFAGVLAAMMMAPTYAIVAGATEQTQQSMIAPRFTTISDYGAVADVDGGQISINADLYAYRSVSLSIDVTVKRNGRTVDSFSASKRGTSLSLSETTDYDSNYDYKVVFEFDAGGETYTVTETV